MPRDALLVVEPDPHGRQLLGRWREAAAVAGLEARRVSEPDSLDSVMKWTASGRALAGVVIGPHVQRPVPLARRIHRSLTPDYILFMADEERASYLRQEMSLAPMMGHYRILSDSDEADLERLLSEVVRSVRQRRQTRTTLDRINLGLAPRPAPDFGAVRRLEEERMALLEREQAARAQAEAASRAKDELLATVSHELRTPLNAILGWARLLRTGQLDPETASRGFEAIERSALAQARLVDDLLDISSVGRGNLRLELELMELSSVVEAAADSIRPAAEAKEIQLQLDLDRSIGSILGDPQRLQQVVWNLVANAVKFTPEQGRVQVSLQALGSHAEIAVRDTGQGISAEFLPFVFDSFRQADSSITRQHGGLGLGLAIVRHLVELHGGTVRAESEGEGRGAAFVLRLPLRRTAGGPTAGSRP